LAVTSVRKLAPAAVWRGCIPVRFISEASPVQTLLLPEEAVNTVLRILAADNEPSVTLSLRYVFSGPRYEITTVGSGQAALAALDASPEGYDIMIVDQKMPNLCGVELVRAIRGRGINGKIIVVSAHLSTEIRDAYKQLGVHVMLSKPFNVDVLRSAVDRLAA
jgi:DNA-binding response OmpR family regulator